MARLIAKTPADGMLPREIGTCRLEERLYEAITWVAPFDGQSEAVGKSIGLGFPEPGQVTGEGNHLALWAGPGQAFVLGPAVAPAGAAVADQSSALTVLTLTGADARAVLARLTPLDLRDTAFPEASTARTMLGHMTASVTRIGSDSYEIMVFRSMTHTAVHEITRAMKGVTARAALRGTA